MIQSSLVFLWTASLLLAAAANNIDVRNPVRSAAEDEVKQLPELHYTPSFRHYSGYLEADDYNNRFWHYWFVESCSQPDKDPLVLWLNGGPGCSSMMGLLTELGPFRVDSNGLITDNPHAWNLKANVIFLESPAGVGYSYSADGSLRADDDTTAKQNHQALKSFIKKFPQFKGRPLYLTGESYAGVYLPTLAVLVDQDPELNLKGVAIGNGYLDANKLAESLVFFSYYHGLVGSSTWQGLGKYCCDGKEPSRGRCKFLESERSTKCGDYVTQASDSILNSGLNPYNLYEACAEPTLSPNHHLSREHFDRSLLYQAFNVTQRNTFGTQKREMWKVKPFQLQEANDQPPCSDDGITIDYLNRKDVKSALHIPTDLKQIFNTCSDTLIYFPLYPTREKGLAPQMQKLLASQRNLTLLIYNGDVDMMCNFFGDEWFVDDLNRKIIADYTAWHVGGQVAGFVKHYDGITFMTVKGSGHLVPKDKPVEALQMINTFLFGHK